MSSRYTNQYVSLASSHSQPVNCIELKLFSTEDILPCYTLRFFFDKLFIFANWVFILSFSKFRACVMHSRKTHTVFFSIPV